MHKPCDSKGKCHTNTRKSTLALNRLSLHLRTHKSTTKNVGDTFLDSHKCSNTIVIPKLPDNFKCLASVKAAAKVAASERRLGDTVIVRHRRLAPVTAHSNPCE